MLFCCLQVCGAPCLLPSSKPLHHKPGPPAQEPLACSELVWGFVFAEEGVCSRFFSGPRFPWHTFGPSKVTVCPPPSHQGVLFPTWWETGFVAVRLPLFLAIVLFFPPEMEISGLMTAPRWRSGRWWSGCRVVL